MPDGVSVSVTPRASGETGPTDEGTVAGVHAEGGPAKDGAICGALVVDDMPC